MKEWRFVKNVHYTKRTKLEVLFVIVISLLVRMELNGAGLEKMGMFVDVVAQLGVNPEIQKVIV